MVSIIGFILVLGLLIFVHEFGHFIVAKKAGLKVEEFGFGFPPRIFSIKRGDTVYSLNLLPIGGFVRILGESGEKPNDKRSFANKSIGIRAAILSAGVAMNILLAMVLLIIGFKIGLPTAVDTDNGNIRDEKIQIVAVSSESPAFIADIKVGDEIIEVDGKKVESVEEVQNNIKDNSGEEIILKVRKSGKEHDEEVKIIPRKDPPENEGPIGVALVKTGIVSYPLHTAIWKGIVSTFTLIGAIVVAFAGVIKNILIGAGVAEEISGPVGIAIMTGQAAKMGFVYLLQFAAILSINLAILNFLPFPALDGGRIIFLVIEKIRGKKVSRKTENLIHTIGFAILIILMILITFRDVFKFKELFINLFDRIRG